MSRLCAPGRRLRVLATRDLSAKAAVCAHPVYRFDPLADSSAQARPWPDADNADVAINGTAAALHYARHGQPNGVVLAGGEFIHLRPDGMKLTGLALGSRVRAGGRLGVAILGPAVVGLHRRRLRPLPGPPRGANGPDRGLAPRVACASARTAASRSAQTGAPMQSEQNE